MSVQIEFLKRCKALGLHGSNLPAWLDHVESLRAQVAELKADNSELNRIMANAERHLDGVKYSGTYDVGVAELKRQRDELLQALSELSEQLGGYEPKEGGKL